jgi:hypothetical protein
LSVSTKATSISGQKLSIPANATPVKAISKEAPISPARRENEWENRPSARVASADPSSVAVVIAPTAVGSNPRRTR